MESREDNARTLDNVSIVHLPARVPGVATPEEIAHSLTTRPVRIIHNRNPFHIEDRRVIDIPPLENESVGAIVTRAGFEPDDFEISLNGNRLEEDAIWCTAVHSGIELVLFTRAAGGKGAGMSAAMLGLLVAVALFTGVGVPFIGFGAMMGLGATATSMIAAGMLVGGAALISWGLAPGLPHQADYSTSYDPTGPKGLARAGVPVPKGCGLFGWCGNVISSYVTYAGKDAYINVLTCYGWGTAKSVTNPRVNGKTINAFQNCHYTVRLGTNDQTPIDGFDRTVNGYPQQIQMLVANGPVVVPGSGTNITGLEVTVKFPSGLYRVTNDGNYVPLKFIYRIQVAPHGTDNWTSPLFARTTETVAITHTDGTQTWPNWVVIPTDQFAGSGLVYDEDVSGTGHTPGDPWTGTQDVTVYDMDGNHTTVSHTFKGEWQPCDPNLNQVRVTDWWEGYRVVQDDTLSPFFDTVSIYGLAPGQWDVRVQKMGYEGDKGNNPEFTMADSISAKLVCDGWLWNVNEVFFSNLSYPNMILVGVKALATSQMSGVNIQVMVDIEHEIGTDTVLPPELQGYEHDNPALVAYDVLCNPTYGAGKAAANIDIPAFQAWADFNDELVTNQDGTQSRRHIFCGVFDQNSDVWKTLGTIGNMSRASIVPMGLNYTVCLDAPADPVQLFTVGNTKKDSFQEAWLSLDDRCSLIECEFADAARDYRMDLPVSVMTADDVNSGIQPKVTRTRLIGCTSRDHAWRWAYFQLLSTKLTLRTVTLTAPIEAVCCRRGSVIAVQADVTQWAVGGRVQYGSTLNTLAVDRTDLAFAMAAGWTVTVQHPAIQRGAATVLSVAGNVITMAAALPAGRIVKAVGPDGSEYVVRGYGGSAITISGSAGTLAAGQSVALWDQNVIDNLEATGVNITTEGATITVAGQFSAIPTPDSAWAYGQSAGYSPAKLFRVIQIKRSGEFNFEITGLEYNSIMYEDVIPNYGEIVGVPTLGPSITNLVLKEQFQNGAFTGSSNTAVIAVGWMNQNIAVGGNVEVQSGDGAWNTLGKINGQGCEFVGYIGTTYNVRVTGFDWAGNYIGSPVTASITVQAATYAPADVTGLTCTPAGTSLNIAWNAVVGADHYEIRYTDQAFPVWNTATVLWDGAGTAWTDATIRTGTYMIVAVSPASSGGLQSVNPAYAAAYPAPPVVTITQSTTNPNGNGATTSPAGGVTSVNSGNLTVTNTIWVTVQWTWTSSFRAPTGFSVVAFTGDDPTATANYLFPVATVDASARSLTVAVSPTGEIDDVNAAVRAIYA
jgi:predicted phage tail protein